MMQAIIIIALLSTAFAVPRTINRIIGGSDTDIETYPYMANMQYSYSGTIWSQSCGGSLITQKAVLSAAHCFYGDLPLRWRVILGTSRRSSGGTVHTIAHLGTHEGFSLQTFQNDIAIVHLNNPAVLSSTIGVARIPGPNYILQDGTTVMALGWGYTEYGGVSEQLQHVDVNVINQALCAERYADLKTQADFTVWPDLTDDMICTGILDVGGKDACQGDSGGPISHDGNIVIGITTWGYGCADSHYPGVGTRVSYFTDWIVKNSVL